MCTEIILSCFCLFCALYYDECVLYNFHMHPYYVCVLRNTRDAISKADTINSIFSSGSVHLLFLRHPIYICLSKLKRLFLLHVLCKLNYSTEIYHLLVLFIIHNFFQFYLKTMLGIGVKTLGCKKKFSFVFDANRK